MEIEFSWPLEIHKSIVPVFLPFLGCKSKCLFCSQEKQTGKNALVNIFDLDLRLEFARNNLINFKNEHSKKAELAFYGGTFTAFDETSWIKCMNFIEDCLEEDLVSSIRCSTRPDSLSIKRLEKLKSLNCNLIELGIQSFNDNALSLSHRGYDKIIAEEACKLVKEYGFELGVQLMPGMPGVNPEIFILDVYEACKLHSNLLRFYPCLVISGTPLARLWENGTYRPWSLADTLKNLAKAFKIASKENISVSRMGLSPDPSLVPHILAGPVHSCLGSRVQGLAFYETIKEITRNEACGKNISSIYVPRHIQGFFWGFKGELKKCWEKLNINKNNVFFWNENHIKLII